MMSVEKSSMAASEVYAAMQVVLCWRLHDLCGGDDSYLEWTETKFPAVYKGLMETLPAWFRRGIERQVPLELFEAMVECVVNAHRQTYLLWKFAQQGVAPNFEPHIPGGGFVQ
jgi:hypothetical protein